MPESKHSPTELTAVDDVRRVRERLHNESAGDLRKHVAETNRIFEELRQGLNIRPVAPPKSGPETTINHTIQSSPGS